MLLFAAQLNAHTARRTAASLVARVAGNAVARLVVISIISMIRIIPVITIGARAR